MKLVAVCTVVATVATVAFGAMVTVACGKKTEERSAATTTSSATTSAGHATCNMIPIAGKCDDYGKEDPLGMAQSLCEGFKGRYSTLACPQDGLVGTCVMKGEDRRRYYVTKDEQTSYSPEDARKDCESDLVQGKFTPVANPPKKPALAPSASASASPAAAPISPKHR